MLVKTLFLAPTLRTRESYQGFYLCALPWKQCLFSLHHYWFFIISFRSLFSSHCTKALLKARNCFQGRPCMLLAGSVICSNGYLSCTSYLELWRHNLCLSVCIHLSIDYFSLLSLPSFLMHCTSKWICNSCKCMRHNLHVISEIGLSLMHMHTNKIVQIAGDVKCVVDCKFHWILPRPFNVQSFCMKNELLSKSVCNFSEIKRSKWQHLSISKH